MNNARDQVAAFLEILKEQHDLDDAKIARVIAIAQKNGKTYATWAWIISILLGLVSFLAIRQLDAIEKHIEKIDTRQIDVKERLRLIEQKVDHHIGNVK